MAGSQLKQLKAALKANGLVGQTNIKRKNKKAKTPSETRRANDESKNILSNLRTQFNQFDTRVNRAKHDYTVIQGGKFVKAGSSQHNNSSKNKSKFQQNMKLDYESSKKQKGRTGGLQDKRFGENNKDMTSEEIMLARFTKERQMAAKKDKKNVFSLGSDDEYGSDEDDDAGFTLTHSGKSLSFEEQDTLGGGQKYYDEDQLMPAEEGQPRRKSKKEVMQEVIAKSKFYRKQRQMEQEKAREDIMDLDDEFGDVMGEINQSLTALNTKQPQFLTKSEADIEYDTRVRELTYERRSVPADRTKTEEEAAQEYKEKMKKLEDARLLRMNGEDNRDAEGDDLDDDFWGQNESENENEEEGFTVENSGESESEVEDEKPKLGRTLPRATSVSMPTNEEELAESLKSLKEDEQINHIKKIVDVYKPNLAEGNKDKMNKFVSILLQHILTLAEDKNSHKHQSLVEQMIKTLKKLAGQFNQSLVESVREEINEIESRILGKQLLKRDLVFFTIIGYLFSTSDHYHLIVTPTLILMNQYLSACFIYGKDTVNSASVGDIGKGIFISEMLLNYQNVAKRYDPEITNFLEKALLALVPEPTRIEKSVRFVSVKQVKELETNIPKNAKLKTQTLNENLSLQSLFTAKNYQDSSFKFKLIAKILHLVDRMTSVWRDKSSLPEIFSSFTQVSKHLLKYYASTLPALPELVNKLTKLETNSLKERKPLTLQSHRALAIPTFAPKFEENFNPDKKSYDPNLERQEINKIRHQLKKEKKGALKDIRKQTKFVAREQIKEKKQMYDEYHKKMANIVNSISTTEGAEKNLYDKERKRRKK